MNKDNINNNDEINEEETSAETESTEEETSEEEAVSEEAPALDEGSEEDDDFSDAPHDNTDEQGSDIDLPLDLDEDLSEENNTPVTLSRREARALKKANAEKKERAQITKTKPFKICVIALAAILVIAAVIYAACIVTLPSNTISKNVFIEDLDVSGLSYNEALKKIEQTYLLENQKITLTHYAKSYDINGNDVALTASTEDTAKKAYDFGKSGNKLKDGLTAFTLIFHKHTISPSASFDEEKMREKINEFGNQALGEFKDHYVEIAEGGKAIVWPGQTGYDGNSDDALAKITEAVKNGNFDGISVTFASKPPEEFTLERFDNEVYCDPSDAHFELADNEIKVVPEENGRYINKEEAAALVVNVKEGGGPIEIPFYYSYPSVTSADLSGKLFANTMASYSTSFASSGSNRASNVARAASLINGKILMPGDVFSFNDTVGRRTVENGFKTAPEYVDGKTVDGIGGGTCQVSSTLYNAVIYSDLEIVTRTNHMFTVAYVANGQDATVADSGPDFKFKNNTPYPIKISAYTSDGQITVAIIGTDYNPKHEVKINNSTSYSPNGNTNVRTTRSVYVNGELLRSEPLPSSTYRKHVEETAASNTNQSSNEARSVSSNSVAQPSSESSEDTSRSSGDNESDSDSDTASDSSSSEDDSSSEE